MPLSCRTVQSVKTDGGTFKFTGHYRTIPYPSTHHPLSAAGSVHYLVYCSSDAILSSSWHKIEMPATDPGHVSQAMATAQ